MKIKSQQPCRLAGLDFKVLSLQRVKMSSGWNLEHVISPFSHLWYVLDGRATVKHHGCNYELEPGVAHLITPKTLYDCQGKDSLDCYQLHFLSYLPDGTELFSKVDCVGRVTVAPEFQSLLGRFWSICLEPGRSLGTENLANRNVIPLGQEDEAKTILCRLLEPFLSATIVKPDEAATPEVFLDVQEFIERHLGQPIMLADLARVAGLHPTYFSDRFQQRMGIRPLEYLMRRRMDYACHLLRTSKASIKEVTYNIGLRDPAYFSRVFLKYCHVSPTAYRTTLVNHR